MKNYGVIILFGLALSGCANSSFQSEVVYICDNLPTEMLLQRDENNLDKITLVAKDHPLTFVRIDSASDEQYRQVDDENSIFTIQGNNANLKYHGNQIISCRLAE